MGKTQSKRSIDITTEGKKTPEEDISGKLEKIDDHDQKQINGDAGLQENVETEKQDGDEIENDKDLTTEKSVAAPNNGSGDSNEGQNTSASNEGDLTAVQKSNKTMEETSPVTEDSSKKSKKEKVKKKWSFRNISFGKKDKQKPAKTEETAADNVTLNGEPAETENWTETTEEEKNNEIVNTDSVTPIEKLENCEASENVLNGEMTSVSSLIGGTVSNENSTKNITTETPSLDSTEINLNTVTENNQTDKLFATTTLVETENEVASTIVSNGAASENGTETLLNVDKKQTVIETPEVSVTVPEKIKIIPSVVNHGSDLDIEATELHQNGVSADGETTESKPQVEVTLQTEIDVLTNKLGTITTISSPNTLSDNLDLNIKTTNMENGTINEKTDLEEKTILEENVFDANLANASDLTHHDELKATCRKFDRSVLVTESPESQDPPPLPISPPPSQMSVFAFNNRNKSEICDDIVTVVAEATVGKPVVKDDVTIHSPVKHSTNNHIESNISEVIIDVTENCPKNLNEGDVKDNTYTAVALVPENLENKGQAEKLCKSSCANQNLRTNYEFEVASAVIDEITEKAVEIIRNQKTILEPSEQQNTNCFSQRNVKTDDKNFIKNVSVNMGSVYTPNSFQCDEKDINVSDSHENTAIKINLPTEVNKRIDDEWQVQSIINEKELKQD